MSKNTFEWTPEMIKPSLISLASEDCPSGPHNEMMTNAGWCGRCGLTSAKIKHEVLKDKTAVIWRDEHNKPLGALLHNRYFVFNKSRIRELAGKR